MSIGFRTSEGRELEARVAQILVGAEVRIGEHVMPLDQFAGIAAHLLGGGLFGWIDHKTPESIDKALSYLFGLYEQKDGKWVRKQKHRAKFLDRAVQRNRKPARSRPVKAR